MAQYTVQDTTTGKNVTFDWSDPNPPSDRDMEEVFTAAKGGASAAPTVSPQTDSYLSSKKALTASPDWKASSTPERRVMLEKLDVAFGGSKPMTKTEETAAKNPTLYGLLGAARGLGALTTETVGQIGGEVVGGLSGGPVGKVAGGGMGYAAARQLNKKIGLADEADYGTDMALGSAFSALPIVGGTALRKLKGLMPKNRAGATLREAYEQAQAPYYAANEQAASEVAQRTGVTPTLGQASNAPELLKVERNVRNTAEGGTQAFEDMATRNKDALRTKIDSLPGDANAFVNAADDIARQSDAVTAGLSRTEPIQSGENIIAAAKAAEQQSKAGMKAAYDALPAYEVPLQTFDSTIQGIEAKALAGDTNSGVNSVLKEINRLKGQGGTPFENAQAIDKTLTKFISGNGVDPYAAGLAKEMQTALRGDLAALDNGLNAGQLIVHNNKVYNPMSLQAEKTALETKLNGLQPNAQPRADIARVKELDDILTQGTAGDDLAAKYATARQTAREHYGKYGNTTYVGDAIESKFGRGVMDAEKVPDAFRTPTGARQLIAAVGKDKAKALMGEHFESQVASMLDSGMNSKQMTAWFVKNRAVLKQYGLDSDMVKVVGAKRNKEAVSKILDADVDSVWAAIQGPPTQRVTQAQQIMKMVRGNPAATAGAQKAFAEMMERKMMSNLTDRTGEFGLKDISKVMDEYGPVMDVVFHNNPAGKQALTDVQKAVQILGRSERVQGTPGSDTKETLIMAQRISRWVGAALGGATGGAVAGYAGSAVGAAAGVAATEAYGKAVNKYLVKALTDPAYARELINATRGNSAARKKVMGQIQRFSQMGAIAARDAESNQER